MILSKKDKRFHTNSFTISAILPLKKKDLSTLTLLEFVLRNKAKGYKNQAMMIQKCEELYALDYQLRHYLTKENIIFEVSFSVVDDQYVEEKNLLNKAMKFIYRVAFDTTKSRYDERVIEEQREIAKNFLSRIQNHPAYLASEGLYRLLDQDWILALPLYGKEEDLQTINQAQLMDLHQRIFAAPKMACFVGPISKRKGESILKKYLTLDGELPAFQEYDMKYPQNVEETREKDILQTHIRLAFSLPSSLSRYEAILLNDLIGGLGTSRLFQEIREKRGLCYSISSTLNPYTHLLVVSLATDTNRNEEAKEAIRKVIRHLHFKKDELEQAQGLLLSNILSSHDNAYAIMQGLQNALRRKETYSIPLYIRQVKKVGIRRINELAKKLIYIGSFNLKGVKAK